MVSAASQHWNSRQGLRVGVIITLLVVISVLIGLQLHTQARKRILSEEAARTDRILSSRINILEQTIANDRTKIQFLNATPPIQGIVRATQNNGVDPYDGTTTILWLQRMETIFTAFLRHNPDIFQARIIGVANDGREILRVERRNHDIFTVHTDQLQEKGSRDYFQAISGLAPGRVYVSDINLNREYGRIQIPKKPAVRFGMPIYDQKQTLFGMLVINIDPTIMLRKLQDDLPSNYRLYLTNSNGGFLVHPNAKRAFDYELDPNAIWDNEFDPLSLQRSANTLQKIQNLASDKNHYANFAEYQFSNLDEGRYLRVIVTISEKEIQAMIYEQSTQGLVVGAAVLLFLVIFILYYQSNVSKTLAYNSAQARYEAIIDGSVDAIISIDLDGRITSWNTSAHDIIGFSGRQALGHPLIALIIVEEFKPVALDAVERVTEGEYLDPIRVDVCRRNGIVFKASVAFSSIKSDNGDVVGVAAIVRDISDLEAAEEVQQLLERQVQERTAELENARNEALSASSAKSNFIANVSHEIRTPLGGIIGMLRLLEKTNSPESGQRYLHMAQSSAESLASLINDVLDLSKIEAGKLDIRREPFNLLSVVSSVVSSMSIAAQEKQIDLIVDTADLHQVMFEGDANRVRQVMINLVGNAVKFTDRGWVKISLSSKVIDSGHIEILGKVEDTGLGISAEKLGLIFDAFSQEDESTTREHGGTGLGLSITRQLCRLMRGKIWVESEKNCGSTFHFRLTLHTSNKDSLAWPQQPLKNKQTLVVGLTNAVALNLKKQLMAWDSSRVDIVDIDTALTILEKQFKHYDYLFCASDQVDKLLARYPQATVVSVVNQLDRESSAAGLHKHKLFLPVLPADLFILLNRMGIAQIGDGPVGQHASVDEVKQNTVNRAALSQTRVLVVDDNETNREVVKGMLSEFNILITTAINGEQAIQKLKNAESPYQLVFMDCQMPILDGYSATRQIRKGAAGNTARDVPIIAVTAAAMAGDRERCTLAGMDDYITKPIDPDELETKLFRWLTMGDMYQAPVNNAPPAAVIPQSVPDNSSRDDADPIWQRAELLRRVHNRDSHLNQVVQVFVDTTPPRVTSLKEAMAGSDFETAAQIAHSLKGATASICAKRLQKLTASIEQQARVHSSDGWPELIAVLDYEVKQLLAALAGEVDQTLTTAVNE